MSRSMHENLVSELDSLKESNMAHCSDIELLAELMKRNHGQLNPTPKKRQFVSSHVELCIGIGRDHTANITIDVDALSELRQLTEQ